MIKFNYFSLKEAHLASGFVIVIDVLRAFTTAAYAINRGAHKIFTVGSIDNAFDLKSKLSGSIIIGEVDGLKPAGFDFGNSPYEINSKNLNDSILIQRTSAGTQGIVKTKGAEQLYAASFVVAKATALQVIEQYPRVVSFIITGESLGRDGDEDRACGDYIQAIMEGFDPDPELFTKRILTSSVGKRIIEKKISHISKEDLLLSMRVDKFPFSLRVRQENGNWVMRKEIYQD